MEELSTDTISFYFEIYEYRFRIPEKRELSKENIEREVRRNKKKFEKIN